MNCVRLGVKMSLYCLYRHTQFIHSVIHIRLLIATMTERIIHDAHAEYN